MCVMRSPFISTKLKLSGITASAPDIKNTNWLNFKCPFVIILIQVHFSIYTQGAFMVTESPRYMRAWQIFSLISLQSRAQSKDYC